MCGRVGSGNKGKTSHTIGTIAQQLEQEIIAAASSTAATAEVTTRMVVEVLRILRGLSVLFSSGL